MYTRENPYYYRQHDKCLTRKKTLLNHHRVHTGKVHTYVAIVTNLLLRRKNSMEINLASLGYPVQASM